MQGQSSSAMLLANGSDTSAALRLKDPSAFATIGATSNSGRRLCYYKPGWPCSEPQCSGNPDDYDSYGNLKATGLMYGGVDQRSDHNKKQFAIHRRQCPACFLHFQEVTHGTSRESNDAKTQATADLGSSSDRNGINANILSHSVTPDSSSAQEEAAASNTSNSDLWQATAQRITKVPRLVGPSEFLIENFNKTDILSITSTVNSFYGFYAQAMICDVYLRSPNVTIIEGIRAECDQGYAIHCARELEPKLFYLLKMLKDRVESEIFARSAVSSPPSTSMPRPSSRKIEATTPIFLWQCLSSPG